MRRNIEFDDREVDRIMTPRSRRPMNWFSLALRILSPGSQASDFRQRIGELMKGVRHNEVRRCSPKPAPRSSLVIVLFHENT
jgi:hypothetical protein